jgi:solute carrier family 25 (mitochondrial phosphate transporter), member 3
MPSTTDEFKAKAEKAADAAVAEFNKASATAQAKTGKIDLYSPKFFGACTLGGALACVCSA